MKKKAVRTKNLTIRVSPEEYARLQEKFKTTTRRVFSDYIRDLLYEKPVTVRYRNQSLDEFLPIALALRKELQAIGKNVNQAVKKINSISNPDELKEAIDFFAAEEFLLRQKVDEIEKILGKMYKV